MNGSRCSKTRSRGSKATSKVKPPRRLRPTCSSRVDDGVWRSRRGARGVYRPLTITDRILILNSKLSFLDHYSYPSIFMDVSGSCPLCLTPPCYHFEPPATAAPFFVPFRCISRRGNARLSTRLPFCKHCG